MIVQAITYTFASEDGDKAAKLFQELRDSIRTLPGVLQFDVARSIEHPHIFALWEVYENQAALDAHFETDDFKRLGLHGIRPLAKSRVAETLTII